MKIGIITFHSAHNYGAVLQAWASQEYLKQQGHEVEIINLRLNVIDKLYKLTKKPNKKVTKIKSLNRAINNMYYQAKLRKIKREAPAKVEKYYKFEKFINEVLPVTKEYKTYERLKKAKMHYDALITGSDQVWNANMMKGISPAYFLKFANQDAIRISYAASIGTDEIPGSYRQLFKRYLSNIDYISVREKKAREEVMALTDKEVDLVADPTFLLKQEDFEKIKTDPKIEQKYIYVHNVHLKRVDEDLNSVAEEMSKRLGLPIVHNWAQQVYQNEAGHFSGGIEEFLGYVANAEYVITNSFHCTVFATIFHRDFITVPHFKNPDRMRNLLEELGIPEHLIARGELIPENLSDLSIDYNSVEEKRTVMREHAQAFLAKALSGEKTTDDRNYLGFSNVFRCYGCGACKDVCPAGAITMESDEEGFEYPAIDKEKCTHCDKCKSVCIYQKPELKNEATEQKPAIYAAYNPDKEVSKKSYAGGLFTALYKKVVEQGGKVVGVRYDNDMKVVYDIADNEQDCERFVGAKFVQASDNNVRPQIKAILDKGELVLYTGTPCHIASLKSYLGQDYPTLYTVEVMCNGVSSPRAFRLYCDFMEEKYKSKVSDFHFTNKFKSVRKPYLIVEFESGNCEIELASRNNFYKAHKEGLIQRPSCYTCEYLGGQRGVADVTIGRFVGVKDVHHKFAGKSGTSYIRINTEKGAQLFKDVKGNIKVRKSTRKKVGKNVHKKPIQFTAKRGRLLYNMDKYPVNEVLKTFNDAKKGGIKDI